MKKILAILIVAVVLIAGAWYVLAKDSYVPELTVTLYSRSNGEVYNADMKMDVDDQKFIDYFYPASVGVDFPSGDNLLEVIVYELPEVNADKYHKDTQTILEREWYVGDLYGKQRSGYQEWTFTIDLPELTTDRLSEKGAVYLLAIVRYGGQDIAMKRWTVNPDGAVS